ncbi:uncharacterized protein LOC131164558 isoform X2 [Malania oleifera]|uniref:uncharacterized protein LOC131164558 isoform X2 n=1 Tax=Malania oleifera TaxID=397392 RepID=UPI0025AEA779|nr:uncharacterized protein LOC131164558 isoform X2 [Malania oleifera]
MDGSALSAAAVMATATATATFGINQSILKLFSSTRRTKTLSFPRRSRLTVSASKEDLKLDKWDQMELKFGRLLGEDPKLTLAKIRGRKLNPDASYLEIEKSYYKKKGKLEYNDVEEVPFDVSPGRQPSSSLNGLNLVRPVPKKGIKFESGDKSDAAGMKKPNKSVGKAQDSSKAAVPNVEAAHSRKDTVPNVILRKPTMFYEDNVEMEKPSRWRLEPNLSLKMGQEPAKEKFSDIMLLKKPEPITVKTSHDSKQDTTGVSELKVSNDVEGNILHGGPAYAETADVKESTSVESRDGSLPLELEIEDDSLIGLQPLEQRDAGSAAEKTAASELTAMEVVDSAAEFSVEAALQGKPIRLDQSVKETSNPSTVETVHVNPERYSEAVDSESLLASSTLKEHEDNDWTRAEDLAKNGGKEEVELINSSTRGFVVSFGSLIGFLPYRNLAAKWKFLAFESWLRRKGLNPSMYKQNLGIIGKTEVVNNSSLPDSDPEINKEISPDMTLEDLLRIYDQDKIKFLSSFIGQRIKVNAVLADRKSRQLVFSLRQKEKEYLVEKKRNLMARLQVGDVVKCCIKKITYFGIFVEVEGVSALIHQTEVSWDATLDPASFFKIGQVVEAKVDQLDFSLERIFLSLKETTPDPLNEALESVVGDHNSLDGRLEAAQADTEVYMASMFENQYKLLARAGNKVQEVMVEATLGNEEMKAAILRCTNRVE